MRRRRACIELDDLSGRELHVLLTLLERAQKAIWRARGHDIANYRAGLEARPWEVPPSQRRRAGRDPDTDF